MDAGAGWMALVELGGYGKFVWPSYGITAVWMMFDAWSARRRLRRAVAALDASAGEEL